MHWVDRICAGLGCSEPVHRVLGWDDLRKLSRGGVTLAAHTRTHPLLNRIPAERVRDEVVGSLNDLEREIGTAPAVLAYPSGGYDDTALCVLREEGFELALTTDRGIHRLRGGDPLRIPRIPVGLRFNRAAFRAQLLPWAGSL
jgi:peptidoglycan/xylan/chitin deacetylase (PgdA/CDA1 family)